MRRLWADSRPRGALFVLLSVGPVLAAAGGARREFFVRTVSWWLTRRSRCGPCWAAVGRSHSGDQRAPFVLIRVPRGGDVRNELRRRGFAVRRGDAFPGLGSDWLRIAVRDPATSGAFARSLREVLT